MIDIAKNSIAVGHEDNEESHKKKHKNTGKRDPKEDLFHFDTDEEEKTLHPPSMMVMSCNLIEATRLRE